MSIGSLFSGVGGLELGLERAGLGPVLWQCEIDPYCRAVLAKHWPDAERHTDVRELHGATLPVVDVLCGGFPCQDVSQANPNGRGLEGKRSGLWYQFARIVEETRPRAVVVENVAGLLGWRLDVVAGRLTELGYSVEATRLQAADVGAPQRRERVFLVAMAHSDGPGKLQPGWSVTYVRGRPVDGGEGPLADDDDARLRVQQGRGSGGKERPGETVAPPDGPHLVHADGGEWAPGGIEGGAGAGLWAAGERGSGDAEPGLGRDADGLSSGLDGVGPGGAWPAGRGEAQHPWEPPRTTPTGGVVAGRPARLRSLGNAVVPQMAYVVGLRVRDLLGLA